MSGRRLETNTRNAIARSKVVRWEMAFDKARAWNMELEHCYKVADTSVILESHGIVPSEALKIALEIFYVQRRMV